jgi:hypothetical protein
VACPVMSQTPRSWSVRPHVDEYHPGQCKVHPANRTLPPVTGYMTPDLWPISGQLLALTVGTKAKRLRDCSLSR